MDLSTTYLGLSLPHPIMPGASPLADDLDVVRQLEDAGAAAIVMHSLFEEQVTREELGLVHDIHVHEESSAEALSYFPKPEDFRLHPERYLEQVRRIAEAVDVPVIGSLNGTTPEGWLHYAASIQQAGADALELNFYHLATDPRENGADVERRLIEIVAQVRRRVTIPIAVKLLPFFSSLSHLAHELAAAGADGLVLFNRLYQPDIDPDMLQAVPKLNLSTSDELLLPVRWLAILSGQVDVSLAASGGVHTGLDAVKAIMAGAHAVQMVAALYDEGPHYLAVVRRELSHWLDQHEYESLADVQGVLSLARRADALPFERERYMAAVQFWKR